MGILPLEQYLYPALYLTAEGGFMGEETRMVFSVVSNRELPRLEKLIRGVDPDSFMVVSRVSEVRAITVEAVQAGQAVIRLKGKIRTILLPPA